ncbi:MAG: hypothetical protein HYW78_01690 [Parcubacteria group bacterium]|nr:hypothetical protein [Parcubacteria group bacterium]
MSITVTTYPIVGAVKGADAILGADRNWEAVNATQKEFLEKFFATGKDDVKNIKELETIASWSNEEINKFLSDRGFSIQLEKFSPREFGVATVLNVLVEWARKGAVTTIRPDLFHTYPGVRIPSEGAEFFQAYGHSEPIALLTTKSGDRVYLTIAGGPPPEPFSMVDYVQQLSKSKQMLYGDFDGVVFPMVHLDQRVDINWLKGMETFTKSGNLYYISQAVQQTIVKMNEIGARAKSAVAIGVRSISISLPKPDYIINKPFLMWIERDGLSKPLFVGYITKEDWKNPGSLGE